MLHQPSLENLFDSFCGFGSAQNLHVRGPTAHGGNCMVYPVARHSHSAVQYI